MTFLYIPPLFCIVSYKATHDVRYLAWVAK
jgi:hypothetical protein